MSEAADPTPLKNAQISPTRPTSHEDVTPVTRNLSNQANRREQATELSNRPDMSQASGQLCVNLDQSKFSSDSTFLRNFTSGNNSPFSQAEGMLSEWRPSKKKSPKTVSVKEAWQYNLSTVQPVQFGTQYVSFRFVWADLICDQCFQHHSTPRIVVGDQDYLKRLRYGTDYWQFQFIVSFAYLVQHISHIKQTSIKRGVDSKATIMPFLQVITYEESTVLPSDLLTLPRDCKTIVGIFHSHDHYAIARIDLGQSRTVTIYDGLYWELTTWMDNVNQLLRRCRLVDIDVIAMEVRGDLPTKVIIPGHRRGKEMVNGLTIVFEQIEWRVIRGDFLHQTDGFNCGPIACLKVMELFQRIDLESSHKCYEKGRIRAFVLDEWNLLVDACDREGQLRVTDTRTEEDAHLKSESSLDYGDSSNTADDSSSVFSSEIDNLSVDDENGLFFRPDCSSMCITNNNFHAHPCNQGHKNVIHVPLNGPGFFVIFPARTFHRGYYNSKVKKTFITAQLFAVFKSQYHTRNSRKEMSESLRYYELQNVLPEKFNGLSNDLLAYWDEHYPSSKFPPPDNYKNAKVDIASNRVVRRSDFIRDMHYVQELVNIFEHLFEGLEVQMVWFIKKSRRGDGFQRWHQDLADNGQTAATIVVNISSIDAEDELAIIDEIRASHRLMEEVSVDTTLSNASGDVYRDDDHVRLPDARIEDHTIGTVGDACNVFLSPAQNSPKKMPPGSSGGHCDDEDQVGCGDAKHESLGTVGVHCDDQVVGFWESQNDTCEVDIDNRKMPPEELIDFDSNVVDNLTMPTEDKLQSTTDVNDQKLPPEDIIHSNSTPQVMVPFVPPFRTHIELPNAAQLRELQGIWICEYCDAHNSTAKNKRCGTCKKWKGGKRELVVRSCYKKTNLRNVNTAPKLSSPIARANKKEAPLSTIAIACKNNATTTSPLTAGLNSLADDETTERDSLQTRREDNDEVIQILDQEDSNMNGDGGDSDGEGEGYEIVQSFIDSMVDVERERLTTDIERVVECDSYTAVEGDASEFDTDSSRLWGAPAGWRPPEPPLFVKPKELKVAKGEPTFAVVDNPGQWGEYTYQPVFHKTTGMYQYHAMPSGATPVPVNPNTGKREIGGYEFFYQGWKHPQPTNLNHRVGATKENLFPEDRQLLLNGDYLRKMGLTKTRMLECDAMFFYQLLLPIVSSGMDGDDRMGFYEEVAKYTNLYAIGIKDRGGTRGHQFRSCTAEELVVWDGIVCRNQSNNIAESWMIDQSNTFDREIYEAMHFRRWLDIKSCLKLNMYWTETKRGDKNYDPTQKYRLVWDVMTFNMNLLIKRAGKDATMDETTWPNSSYADMHNKFVNKKTDMGGQHVLLLDAKRRFIYAYTARHKFYEPENGWTAMGHIEVKRMLNIVNPLIVGNYKDVEDKRRQIFEEPPHLTMDNFFSGDKVINYLGEQGWKGTMTCRRDRLPNGVDKKHFNYVKGAPVNQRSRVARFNQPIVAVKHVLGDQVKGTKPYTLVHCSFQSTGGTNISCVNAMSEVGLYVQERNRGRGNEKRTWAIEMNEPRDTYLKTYSAVDKIDQTLLNYDINYRSWKWWHAPMRHAKAIAMSMAYNIYLQCSEGGVDPDWKVKPVSSTQFKQKLSIQMVQYKACNKNYLGDEKMRGATQQNKKRRGDNDTAKSTDNISRVSYERYVEEKKQRRHGKKPRLCSDNLDLLKEHINSFKKTNPALCGYCGTKTYMKCMLCETHLCFKSGRNIAGMTCSIDYHNDKLYGLGFKDRRQIFNVQIQSFCLPTKREMKENGKYMEELKKRYNDENMDLD